MGRKTVSGAAAEQQGKDCTLGPDWAWWTNSRRERRGNQHVRSQRGALGYPSLAIWTAQVTSSSPHFVAYPSFPSLTFASGFSEHWGGERTCPQVKAAQLKFPPKLSGCSLGFRVTAAIIWCTSTPRRATWTLADWGQGSHDSQPDKNLLSRQETIPEARKQLYTSRSESLKHGNPPKLREKISSNEKQSHIQPIPIMSIRIKTHKTKWVQIPERRKPVTGKPAIPVSAIRTKCKSKQQKLCQMENTRCFTIFTISIVKYNWVCACPFVWWQSFWIVPTSWLRDFWMADTDEGNEPHAKTPERPWPKTCSCLLHKWGIWYTPRRIRSALCSSVLKSSTLGSQAGEELGFWFTVQMYPQEACRACLWSICAGGQSPSH